MRDFQTRARPRVRDAWKRGLGNPWRLGINGTYSRMDARRQGQTKVRSEPNPTEFFICIVFCTYRGRPGLAAWVFFFFARVYYRWWTWGDLENCATQWDTHTHTHTEVSEDAGNAEGRGAVSGEASERTKWILGEMSSKCQDAIWVGDRKKERGRGGRAGRTTIALTFVLVSRSCLTRVCVAIFSA